MPVPEFIVALRRHVGHAPLWLIGVTAVVLRGSDVLLVKRADNGAWTPVTGVVDPGEHPADAAAREVLEETGVTAAVRRLASVTVTDPVVHVNGDQAQYVDHTFRCDYIAGEAHVADDESAEVRWCGVDDLPPMAAHMRARIEAALSNEAAARLA